MRHVEYQTWLDRLPRPAMRFRCLALLASLGLVAAIHESDAGVIDWHKRLIGVPLTSTPSTAPVFHRVGQKNTKSVILAVTEQNVLAALNPVDGSLGACFVMRDYTRSNHLSSMAAYISGRGQHRCIPKTRPMCVDSFQSSCLADTYAVVASLSGPGGATLRAFDVLDGSLLLEKRLHSPENGLLLDSIDMGGPIVITDAFDIITLTNGHTVNYFSRSGQLKWTWASEDQT